MQKLLSYQGDSSAFDNDDYKKVFEIIPLDLPSRGKKLVMGLFQNYEKPDHIFSIEEKQRGVQQLDRERPNKFVKN